MRGDGEIGEIFLLANIICSTVCYRIHIIVYLLSV